MRCETTENQRRVLSVSVVINMGTMPLANLQEYWSRNVVNYIPFYSDTFTRDRFSQIFWMLHLETIPTRNTNPRTRLQRITGAGQGLGRELAIQFAELGATVICWDQDAPRNNAVVSEIRSKDGECFGFTIDVTVREQVAALAARMRRQLADVSMVVSNAGAFSCAPIAHLKPEAISRLIEVNLLAHFWIIQAFLPSMIERRHGHIVAINSSAGLLPCADMVPYCAAKFGLRGLMDSITEELRLDTWTKNIYTTSVYLATLSTGLYPPPAHRFTSWYSEITAKEAATIIIDGIRKNHKDISIPSFMKPLIALNNVLPYRIRIIFMDFFNFRHRGWFSYC
ncbi:17-beta-hydroxysteroid dehydrogenase 13-like isoform X1 [Battus philenor]|uniref:17-beta-hydroxysteroid dehydrogenase 13-like isoform X1 n=1 Tax=Battus philenor TaxID=42288 RepID=UPI0035CE9384